MPRVPVFFANFSSYRRDLPLETTLFLETTRSASRVIGVARLANCKTSDRQLASLARRESRLS